MNTLSIEELSCVEGGNDLGNYLLFAGGVIVAVGTGGTAGVVAGVAIAAVGYISSL